MNLQTKYPRIFTALEEEVEELRHLLVVDFNYDDVDSDEFDVFDPSDYNFLVYVTERMQHVLGQERLVKVIASLSQTGVFDDFYADQVDMFGVKTDNFSEEEIAIKILDLMESTLS